MSSLWDAAVDAVQWPPTRPIAPCAPPQTQPCGGAFQRRLLVAAMFSFEVDTLRVFLAQHRGIADVLLVESRQVHNVHETRAKPLLWSTTALSSLASNDSSVASVVCPPGPKRAMWDAEAHQNACMSEAVRARRHDYDVVVVGSVDEILGRSALLRLKHCALPDLPTSSAIGMPLGLLGRKFRTDWHYADRPFSFALPSVYSATFEGAFVRSFRPLGRTAVVGGLHMTNYCFLPNMVLKELTATEYGHHMSRDALCNASVRQWKDGCYAMMRSRTQPGASREAEAPCALSALALPAWSGKVDPRERRFWNAVCGRRARVE